MLAAQLNDVGMSIFNLHVPPYASGLDEAPALDERLTLKVGAGAVQMAPAGRCVRCGPRSRRINRCSLSTGTSTNRAPLYESAERSL